MSPEKSVITKQFFDSCGYHPNIDNPKTFNEKIQWLKLYYREPLLTKCADKYEVRDYVSKTIGEKYLITLINVFEKSDDISFDLLPNQFVLKANNSSGNNFICKDKSKLNKKELIDKINRWLEPQSNHYYYSYEWAYKDIKPKIICEKYLEQSDKGLTDYKVYCFHGKPEFVRTFRDRFGNMQKNTYDLNWNPMPFSINSPNSNLPAPKPKNLKLMIELSKKLARPFPFVRIDFYNIKGTIFFGDLTFYPSNGIGVFSPDTMDNKYGKLIDIDKIINDRHQEYLKQRKTRQAKTVIYTAISDNYDDLIKHSYVSKEFDYICFTNQKIDNPGIWEIRPLKYDHLDPVRRSRYYKLHPHEFLPDYKYSIWIDSNIDITNDELEKRVNQLINKKYGISMNIHGERNCIYKEAYACIKSEKDNPQTIINQIKFLKEKDYPPNNGLFEANIIYRNHHNKNIRKLMSDWWDMILKYSRRDQLSFNYVLSKNKLKCIQMFPTNSRSREGFRYYDHHIQIPSYLYYKTKEDELFTENISILHNNIFSVKFYLSHLSSIERLRLEFLTHKFCRLRINEIIITHHKNIKKLSLSKIGLVTNGEITADNYINFMTYISEICIDKQFKADTITINGEMYFYDYTDLFSNLRSKNESLNQDLSFVINELTNIKTSKFFLIWQKYNLIKEYFTKMVKHIHS